MVIKPVKFIKGGRIDFIDCIFNSKEDYKDAIESSNFSLIQKILNPSFIYEHSMKPMDYMEVAKWLKVKREN